MWIVVVDSREGIERGGPGRVVYAFDDKPRVDFDGDRYTIDGGEARWLYLNAGDVRSVEVRQASAADVELMLRHGRLS